MLPRRITTYVATTALLATLMGCTSPNDHDRSRMHGDRLIDDHTIETMARKLTPFETCEDLRMWQTEHNVTNVGPYGWNNGGPIVAYSTRGGIPSTAEGAPADAQAKSSSATGQSSSSTGTNTQEQDVDEPDFVKTNGKIAVSVFGARLRIDDGTGAKAVTLGRYDLPRNTYANDLLLVGDHVLISADGAAAVSPRRTTIMPIQLGTSLMDFDISDPANPRLVRTTSYSGRRVSARQYGDVVRLVLSDGLPSLDFVQPGNGLTEREATLRNQEVVRRSTIEQWLPSVTVDGKTTPAVDCADVLHPGNDASGDTISVITYSPTSPDKVESTAITAAGDNVYSSKDHLFVTSTNWPMIYGPMLGGDVMTGAPTPMKDVKVSTDIHQFDLDGLATKYVASGRVSGSVKDNWSMDEYDGDLRVARSHTNNQGTIDDNGVVVLRRDGSSLKQIGVIDNLGINEQIQSVRWLDTMAVVVTFRQMDPLYTIDLTDPKNPKKLGELKIPGFSSYLHPIGRDQLIGVGVDANEKGQRQGAQLATFDISDPKDAKQVQVEKYGPDSYLSADGDPKAFTWLPDLRTAVTSVSSGTNFNLAVLLIKVNDDGSFTQKTISPEQGRASAIHPLPLPGNRVAIVGETGVDIVPVG